MPPKPFPSQYRVGIDICEIERFSRIIHQRDHSTFLRWGSKIFSRLEWPLFLWKIRQYRAGHNDTHHQHFASWLAGRWAAKEAAIKAHENRRLRRTHVSIIPQPPGVPPHHLGSSKPWILIDPPKRPVVMDGTIANRRGLGAAIASFRRERTSFAPNSEFPSSTTSPEYTKTSHGDELYTRQHLVEEDERRRADLSISHDGRYATAVCIALDETFAENLQPILDNGEGAPIHEPIWGDMGFEYSEAQPGSPESISYPGS
ncbi:hypothetical protein MMC19_003730 [Ptychographa xylographoides]|nr:hypothetical protein [Ptychographa xylographoides]